MELKNTKNLIEKRLKNNDFDTYAVFSDLSERREKSWK